MAASAPPTIPATSGSIATAFARFFSTEAASGVVLLFVTAIALLWANSPAAPLYHALWHTPLTLSIGGHPYSLPLEFGVNDGLMTIFFLVVGLELRRELHSGVLSEVRAAAFPIIAALGGVAAPAVIYLVLNTDPQLRTGWAVPTATDIAFAVGVLALLGRRVASPVRMLLLAVAVIDDIVAIAIIAFYFSSGLSLPGLLVAASGVGLVYLLQYFKVRTAWGYVLPGAVLWFGLLKCGIHPTLAGVVLGMMTPVDAGKWGLRSRRSDELVPPVERVQRVLHPWVAFGVMPLFALANAGVDMRQLDLHDAAAASIAVGVAIALLLGKPLGIFVASYLAVKSGVCRLPAGVGWRQVLLVGLIGGIGFTMAIFIASLAFDSPQLLDAAKFGILVASGLAGVAGLLYGWLAIRKPADSQPA
jgi:Na+:H+ antiporter, NhaA family